MLEKPEQIINNQKVPDLDNMGGTAVYPNLACCLDDDSTPWPLDSSWQLNC